MGTTTNKTTTNKTTTNKTTTNKTTNSQFKMSTFFVATMTASAAFLFADARRLRPSPLGGSQTGHFDNEAYSNSPVNTEFDLFTEIFDQVEEYEDQDVIQFLKTTDGKTSDVAVDVGDKVTIVSFSEITKFFNDNEDKAKFMVYLIKANQAQRQIAYDTMRQWENVRSWAWMPINKMWIHSSTYPILFNLMLIPIGFICVCVVTVSWFRSALDLTNLGLVFFMLVGWFILVTGGWTIVGLCVYLVSGVAWFWYNLQF